VGVREDNFVEGKFPVQWKASQAEPKVIINGDRVLAVEALQRRKQFHSHLRRFSKPTPGRGLRYSSKNRYRLPKEVLKSKKGQVWPSSSRILPPPISLMPP
jgi:hypothetical protein